MYGHHNNARNTKETNIEKISIKYVMQMDGGRYWDAIFNMTAKKFQH